jgi:hypothetical protein
MVIEGKGGAMSMHTHTHNRHHTTPVSAAAPHAHAPRPPRPHQPNTHTDNCSASCADNSTAANSGLISSVVWASLLRVAGCCSSSHLCPSARPPMCWLNPRPGCCCWRQPAVLHKHSRSTAACKAGTAVAMWWRRLRPTACDRGKRGTSSSNTKRPATGAVRHPHHTRCDRTTPCLHTRQTLAAPSATQLPTRVPIRQKPLLNGISSSPAATEPPKQQQGPGAGSNLAMCVSRGHALWVHVCAGHAACCVLKGAGRHWGSVWPAWTGSSDVSAGGRWHAPGCLWCMW